MSHSYPKMSMTHVLLSYFQSNADAMTITLPFVAHEMGEGFQLIKDNWKFWENPMESFKGMDMSLVKQVIFVSKYHTVIEIRVLVRHFAYLLNG